MRETYIRNATIVRVIDGDTLDVDIDLGWGIIMRERIRLANYDAPETRGEERQQGLHAKALAIDWASVNGNVCLVESVAFQRGKYGRTIANVYGPATDDSLADYLDARRKPPNGT